jgi:molybdopterin converting factor small subunit
MKTIKLKYFAELRDQAGKVDETHQTYASNYLELYHELKERYNFNLSSEYIKVAENNSYTSLTSPVLDQALVVFIPPVAGG